MALNEFSLEFWIRRHGKKSNKLGIGRNHFSPKNPFSPKRAKLDGPKYVEFLGQIGMIWPLPPIFLMAGPILGHDDWPYPRRIHETVRLFNQSGHSRRLQSCR